MPSELRTLVFSNEELREAVLHYHKTAVQILPSQRIASCEVKNGHEVTLHLLVYDEAQSKNVSIVLETCMVAAVLLKYCFKTRIPIPRTCEKSLQVIGDNIALKITINAQTSKCMA